MTTPKIEKVNKFLEEINAGNREGSAKFMEQCIEGVQEARRQEALLKDSVNPLKLNDDLHGILGDLDGNSFSGLHSIEGLQGISASDLQITNPRPLPGGALMVDIIYKGKPYRNKSIFPPNMTYKDTIKLAFDLGKQINFENFDSQAPLVIEKNFILDSGLRIALQINRVTKTLLELLRN